MANVLAVKQRRTYKLVKQKGSNKSKRVSVPAPTAANLAHASAIRQASYWLNGGDDILTSQQFNNMEEVTEAWKRWREEAITLYTKHHSMNRKPPKNTVLIEEMLLIIGKDVRIENYETLILSYIEMFENKYDTHVYYWTYHDHEGHVDDAGVERINRHVHIFFRNINNNGKSVRRKWHRQELSHMQTDVFEVGKHIGLQIVRATKNFGRAPKGKSHRGYREEKKKEAEKQHIVKQQVLNEKINQLIAEITEMKNSNRRTNTRLVAMIKSLRKRGRAKRVTQNTLQNEISALVSNLTEKDCTISELEKLAYTGEEKRVKKRRGKGLFTKKYWTVKTGEKETYKDLAENLEAKQEALLGENEELKNEREDNVETIAQQNDEIETLKKENMTLKESNISLNLLSNEKDTQLMSQKQKIGNLNQELVKKSKEEEKITKVESENKTLKTKNKALQEENAEKDIRIKNLIQRIENLKSLRQSKVGDIKYKNGNEKKNRQIEESRVAPSFKNVEQEKEGVRIIHHTFAEKNDEHLDEKINIKV